MWTPSIPPPPRLPSNMNAETERAEAGNLLRDIDELRAALAEAGALIVKIDNTLARVGLAQLTSEHRQNTQRAKLIAGGRMLVAHEREIREIREALADLQSKPDTAAE